VQSQIQIQQGFGKKTRKNSGEGYGIVRFNRVPEKVPGSLGVKS
jgi:hypothetical protein